MTPESLEVTRKVLGSGLRFVCTELARTHRAAIMIHVRTGSRFEPAELGGVSHFFEHMLHRGTRSYPSAHALALEFERLGSELGAATYVDHTLLSAAAPPENLEAVLDVLGEVVTSPVFSGIEIERGIVREEILESLSESGEPIDPEELLIALAFPDHGLGRPIAGTLAGLERFDSDVLSNFHRSHYHADSMVVTVASPFEPARVEQAVERAFAGIPRGSLPADRAPEKLSGPCFRYVEDAGSQTALRLGFRAPAEPNALEPATELLLRTLDDGMSTRLYHEVCDERGLAYDVSATYEAFADAGLLVLAGDSAHSRSEELLDALFSVVSSLRDEGPSEEELAKAKRRFAWQMQAMLDDPGELAAFLGLGELTGVARTPEERVRTLLAQTREQVQIAARQIFTPSGLAAAAVGKLSPGKRKALERKVRSFT